MGGHWREAFQAALLRGTTFDVVLPDPDDEHLMEQLEAKASFGEPATDLALRVRTILRTFTTVPGKTAFSSTSERPRQVEVKLVNFLPPFTCYRFGRVGVMRMLPGHNPGVACPILLLNSEGKLWQFVGDDFDRTWRFVAKAAPAPSAAPTPPTPTA